MESSKDDVKNIIEGIKRFMPDFNVTKNDLVNIKSPFVIAFYHRYINELVKYCRGLFNNEPEFEDIYDVCPRGIEPEMFLFHQIRDILNRIGVTYFTICDFYRPSNRTRLTMKVCLNFLVYIKENLPKGQVLVQMFNSKVNEHQLKLTQIFEKKKLVGELSQRLGLAKESLGELQKEYEAEVKLQDTPLETQVQLDKEIHEIEEEIETTKKYLDSHQGKKVFLDAKIKELKEKVISQDYDSLKEELDQLQLKIEVRQKEIQQSEQTLAIKHEELEFMTEQAAVLQTCNISVLNYVEKVDSLKQKAQQLESVNVKIKASIDKREADLAKEDLDNADKKHEEYIKELKSNLSQVNDVYDKAIAELHCEKKLFKDLQKEISVYTKQLEAIEQECDELEKEHIIIQTEIQRVYRQMLSSQNLITTSFDDMLKKFS